MRFRLNYRICSTCDLHFLIPLVLVVNVAYMEARSSTHHTSQQVAANVRASLRSCVYRLVLSLTGRGWRVPASRVCRPF